MVCGRAVGFGLVACGGLLSCGHVSLFYGLMPLYVAMALWPVVRRGFVALVDWGFVAGGRLWVCSPMVGEVFEACG